MDSFAANKRFSEDIGVSFPLLSDFKREVSRAYGVLNEEGGYAERVTFVIDKEGIIRHVERGRDAIDSKGALEAVRALSASR